MILLTYCAVKAGWWVSGFPIILKKGEKESAASIGSEGTVCRNHPVSRVRGIS